MADVETVEGSKEITFVKTDDDRYRCLVCPHRCTLREGQTGVCQVREAKNGIILKGYGKLSHIAIEPIEKKPIYHYKPNLKTLSIGSWGCSMACSYCQNWMVSQVDKTDQGNYWSPESVISLALEKRCSAICFTYNEPIVYFEYVMDLGKECKKFGLDLILKTNAFAELPIWLALCKQCSAMNIDWKGNEARYRKIAKATEKPVRDCIEAALGLTHLEISIPVYPDSTIDEHMSFVEFIGKQPSIPIHLLKIYPAYRDIGCQVTSDFLLKKLYKLYRQQSSFVYQQNVYDAEGLQDTKCPKCNSVVVHRESLRSKVYKANCCNCPIIVE